MLSLSDTVFARAAEGTDAVAEYRGSVERLAGLVPPPTAAPRRRDWGQVEREIGTALPSDYKRVIDVYGGGRRFGEFIYLYDPDSSNAYMDLAVESRNALWALRELEDVSQCPYALGDPPELLAWGRNDNGDPFFWHRAGPDPDSWTVAVSEEGDPDEWFTFDGGLAEFLCAVLSGEVRVPFFPENFPPAAGS
ncbi:SMI1/KNR4 family protein [Streptomyces sp. NPDC048172]|uniref:SMI1/KNR4 family protein n=1 Tax=Streptomyces sp. NPDC048172 TaxID=3365505 RepID=UPI003716BAEC